MSTDSRPGGTARHQTDYMNTTGKCLELFFRSSSDTLDNVATVSVIAISEENEETTVASSDGTEPLMWNRLFAVLPEGINQIAVQGRRSQSGFSSLSVDDVYILNCTVFGIKLLYLVGLKYSLDTSDDSSRRVCSPAKIRVFQVMNDSNLAVDSFVAQEKVISLPGFHSTYQPNTSHGRWQ